MSLSHLALAPLALFLGQSAIDVPAPNGRFVARVAKLSGQEAVADSLARWQLSVHDVAAGGELWSMRYPRDPSPARYFIADDGSTFVRLSESFSEARPVLRMDRFGRHTVERTGADFALERDDVERDAAGARWLAEEGDLVTWGWGETGQGPALLLTLESVRGWRRQFDASMGLVIEPVAWGEGGDLGEPTVIPGFPEGSGPAPALEVPYVTQALIPAVSLGALPLRIEVIGQHATPNWKLFAFSLRRESEDRFVLTPYSQPPPSGSVRAQVLDGFRSEVMLQGLKPGRYQIAVQGSEGAAEHPAAMVEILPGRMHARLEISGGVLGIHDVIEVFKPGIVRATRGLAPEAAAPRHLLPEELDRLQELVGALPDDLRSAKTVIGSDFFEYRLGWWAGDGWREVALDDGTAQGPAGRVIELLRGL